MRFLLPAWYGNHLNFLHIEREYRKGGGFFEGTIETFFAARRDGSGMAGICRAYNCDCHWTGNLGFPCKRVFIRVREKAGSFRSPPFLLLTFRQCFFLLDRRSAYSIAFHPHGPDTCRNIGISTGVPALFWWMLRIMHSIYFLCLPYVFPFLQSLLY